ncbi:MAG: ABC transporter ATP-binding protein [Methanocellales archaeon]|nr:ABC transporter ATP-binding protein [Methanocellales archaeon]
MRLEMFGVTFSYASTPVLENVTMKVDVSEILGIIGPNGAGKTTLLRCIDRILKLEKGSILLDGREMEEMSRREIAKHIGYVPQTTSGGFPTTVFDAVLLGRRPYISWGSSDRDIEKVLEALELLEIEDLALRDFNELSGGERQKVLIARALAQEPDVLLLDEPTSNLDIRHQLEVMEIIKNLVRERRISAVMAIHDLNLAARYSDRIIMLNGGSIFDAGSPTSVLTPENIKCVYGVEAKVNDDSGRPHILPIKPTQR